jgi:hypothetical protein
LDYGSRRGGDEEVEGLGYDGWQVRRINIHGGMQSFDLNGDELGYFCGVKFYWCVCT